MPEGNEANNIHPKATGAGLGGALSIILVFVLAQVGVNVTAEVAAALTTVLAFAGSYLKAP